MQHESVILEEIDVTEKANAACEFNKNQNQEGITWIFYNGKIAKF
jgi:hypothetical protein